MAYTTRSMYEHSRRSTREKSSRRARTGAALFSIAVSSLVLAACANSPAPGVAQVGTATTTAKSPSVTTTNKYAAWLAFSRCVRAHGFATYPDPTQVDGEVQVAGAPAGVNPTSPAFTAALGSCRHLEPNGGLSTNAERLGVASRLLKLSRCMRQQGITGFPDPTFSAPSGRGGYSDIRSNDGVWLAIPNSVNVHSPMFSHASIACDFGPAS